MNEEYQNLTRQEHRELKKQRKEQEFRQNYNKRLMKRTALWVATFFILGLFVFGISKVVTTSYNSGQSAALVNAIAPSDHVIGNKDSKVVLIEYGDFQCPACGQYYFPVHDLLGEYKDKIQFSYRQFPLRQIHANAELAARSSEAAGEQDKFWEMYDLIFKNQSDWSKADNARDIFVGYAQELKLNIDRFKNDIDSKAVVDKIENDYQGGIQSGVNATPTFFLNGKKVQNPRSYDEFKSIIEQALKTNNP